MFINWELLGPLTLQGRLLDLYLFHYLFTSLTLNKRLPSSQRKRKLLWVAPTNSCLYINKLNTIKTQSSIFPPLSEIGLHPLSGQWLYLYSKYHLSLLLRMLLSTIRQAASYLFNFSLYIYFPFFQILFLNEVYWHITLDSGM